MKLGQNDHPVVAITIYMKKDPEEGGQMVLNKLNLKTTFSLKPLFRF